MRASTAQYFFYHGVEYFRASLGYNSMVTVETGSYKGIYSSLRKPEAKFKSVC